MVSPERKRPVRISVGFFLSGGTGAGKRSEAAGAPRGHVRRFEIDGNEERATQGERQQGQGMTDGEGHVIFPGMLHSAKRPAVVSHVAVRYSEASVPQSEPFQKSREVV